MLNNKVINLNDLVYKDKIEINETINYDKSYIENTDIIELNDVKVEGMIYKDYEENTVIKVNVDGIMILSDAITLENVPYKFNIEIEEILENSQKTLDLIEFLWHYIVLEIPIRYTTSDIEELKNKYKDIYSEGENPSNNPFKDFFRE